MPDLEELRLSEDIPEIFLAVIKEQETLVPKLSRVFILNTGGVKVPLQLEGREAEDQRGPVSVRTMVILAIIETKWRSTAEHNGHQTMYLVR